MKIRKNKIYAVITGDIVRSSKLPLVRRKKLVSNIGVASDRLRKFFGDIVPLPVDIFRGDSWQMLISDHASVVTAAVFFRATLKDLWKSGSIDTRIAIGVGKVDFIPGNRVSEGDGEAFRLAAEALESMNKHVRMQCMCSDKELEKNINVIVHLLDAIVMRWTDKQALAVSGAMRGFKQEEITRLWDPSITQQNVAKHLSKAKWYQVKSALDYTKNNLKKL